MQVNIICRFKRRFGGISTVLAVFSKETSIISICKLAAESTLSYIFLCNSRKHLSLKIIFDGKELFLTRSGKMPFRLCKRFPFCCEKNLGVGFNRVVSRKRKFEPRKRKKSVRFAPSRSLFLCVNGDRDPSGLHQGSRLLAVHSML